MKSWRVGKLSSVEVLEARVNTISTIGLLCSHCTQLARWEAASRAVVCVSQATRKKRGGWKRDQAGGCFKMMYVCPDRVEGMDRVGRRRRVALDVGRQMSGTAIRSRWRGGQQKEKHSLCDSAIAHPGGAGSKWLAVERESGACSARGRALHGR